MDLAQKKRFEMKTSQALFFLSIFWFVSASWSQVPVPLSDSLQTENNQSGSPNSMYRSTIDKTLESASQKLRSKVESDRVGAAKLLGKYTIRNSSLLLIGSLNDSSALVRRAVLVSLVEHYNNGQIIYEPALVEKIYSRLGDPDVEVRREVSALIPRLVPGLLQSGMEKFEINGRVVYRSRPGKLRPDLEELTQAAFLDPDSVVRQNLLRNHFSLRVQIPPTTMVKLLQDQDSRVLLVALDQVRIYARFPGIDQAVKQLAKHKDFGVRAKVAQTAGNLSRSYPDYRDVLRVLLKDKDQGLAAQSAIELARLGERLSAENINMILDYLLSVQGLDDFSQKIFDGLSALGGDATKIYRALTEHPSGRLRAIAWQRFLVQSNGWHDATSWMPALRDRNPEVRELVLGTIRGRISKIEEDELGVLIDSKYPEVRVFAAESFLLTDIKVVESRYMDLLIDEDGLVRSVTLRSLAKRRVPGWMKVHILSLLDPNYAIQRAAMDGLLSDAKVGVPALLDFVRAHPTVAISSLALQELERLGFRP